ncbi:MAG: Fe-S protein assembly co-chaperone HscB [Neisseria sp.]|nr:Fe-S protein assembly co-chaperone HscB [Neisseria sp.]
MHDYFALFQLPAHFALDTAQLDAAYRTLAMRFHPDRTASLSAFEQKQAMMMAATVNEAYRVLKQPLERAAYLLQEAGIDADAPQHTQFAPEFLMQQMEWREALGEADDAAALSALAAEFDAARSEVEAELEAAFAAKNHDAAADALRRGRFIHKLNEELAAKMPD